MGEDRFQYDPAHYLLATVELPVVTRVLEASPERPYLSLRLELEPALVGSVMVEAGHLSLRNGGEVRAIDVSPVDASLLDAVVRLVRLMLRSWAMCSSQSSKASCRFMLIRLLVGAKFRQRQGCEHMLIGMKEAV